jgi:hypothetical protein
VGPRHGDGGVMIQAVANVKSWRLSRSLTFRGNSLGVAALGAVG